jgi:pyridoxal phosphate-dependent aminotransferase EpsN
MDIFLSPPSITKREKEYVLEALESNWLAPNGPFVKKLETSIAQRLRFSISVISKFDIN